MQFEAPSLNLRSLTYVSSAAAKLSTADLLSILQASRRNNTAIGVTGLLLYKDGNFMQVLEGEEEAVQTTHLRIARDPRHHGLITLLDAPVERRSFEDWSMGFQDLSGDAPLGVPGYHEFRSLPLVGKEFTTNPSRAQKLLLTFRARM